MLTALTDSLGKTEKIQELSLTRPQTLTKQQNDSV